MKISNHKNTILIIIAVFLMFFGYWFFFLSKKDAQPGQNTNSGINAVKTQTPTNSANTQYDKEFVTSLLGLNSVNLDVKIFESKVYQALSYPEIPFVVNYSRDSGRNNPFLPAGLDVSGAEINTSQTAPNTVITPTTPTPPQAQTTTPAPVSTTTKPATPTPKRF